MTMTLVKTNMDMAMDTDTDMVTDMVIIKKKMKVIE